MEIIRVIIRMKAKLVSESINAAGLLLRLVGRVLQPLAEGFLKVGDALCSTAKNLVESVEKDTEKPSQPKLENGKAE